MHRADTKPFPFLLDAVKVTAGSSAPSSAVTYVVVEKSPAKTGEKRGEARRRTRLRSGKVLDAKNKFLIECQVHDRSAGGARLRLVANVSAPAKLRLFDDETKTIRDVRIIWRRNQELGVRFVPQSYTDTLPPAERAALARKYYAVRD
jgi:hypothetical protein